MTIKQFLLHIRRRETPFYDWLYRFLKKVRTINIPVIKPLHCFLYTERRVRLTLWRGFIQLFYYEPLFKSQCEAVGNGLNLIGGIPLITGNLNMVLGDRVTLHGKSTFVGAKVFDNPTLRVGNNTHLGYMLHIIVGCDVTIGDNVLIAGEVCIYSYDQHGSNPEERHFPPPSGSSKPIVIEDNVWIAEKCIIMKGVTIGKNSIVAVGSVVTQKVPPDSLVFGNPARVFPLVY